MTGVIENQINKYEFCMNIKWEYNQYNNRHNLFFPNIWKEILHSFTDYNIEEFEVAKAKTDSKEVLLGVSYTFESA
eukprot:CAMPEP_0116892152 /NCGR_PEP_ID=MMETSP0467-20121206/2430_1 /TAXON_ID=283647 /ORGANISM="Mesodinium pulex, Strain SPMC105" /LENGTH=75 /DNA_ID=CAMNT_0004561105 /DNA_START=2197 /DNA_END=2424 /DNA_ORIENTATION=+